MISQHCERTKGSRILHFRWLSQPQKTKLNVIKEIHDHGKKIIFPTGQNGPEVSSYIPSPLPKGNKESVSRPVVSDSATPWTVARQVPLSMGFSRQEYWSGLPSPPPGDLPDPGIKPRSSTLQADFYHLSHQGSPKVGNKHRYNWLCTCLKCFLPI